MKVVLFCGGQGTRIRDHSANIPKPLVTIGYRPILWHLMKYYAHYGHNDFILCLGYRADAIKNYFLNYDETTSNDFILSQGGEKVELLNNDIRDWKITFVDTGMHANIGQRLKAVEKHLEGESVFMANYSDGLTDMYLPTMVDNFQKSGKIAQFLSVRPSQSFHVTTLNKDNTVQSILPVTDAGFWMNGGFFIFKDKIFNYIKEREELVYEPFQRLIKRKELISYPHKGFWGCMDTFKEKQFLEDLFSKGNPPWVVWDACASKGKC